MALIRGLATLCFLVVLAAPSGAATINFDDIVDPGIIGVPLTSPYQGFDWENYSVYEDSGGVFPTTDNGIVSPKNAVFTGGEVFDVTGAIVPFVGQISRTTPFDFISAYLGGFNFSSMDVTLQGFLGGSPVASTVVTVDVDGADQFFFPGFTNVDTVRMFGLPPSNPEGCTFNCTQFTMDDFEYGPATVPEPVTLLLVGTGLAAVGMRRYRQRK